MSSRRRILSFVLAVFFGVLLIGGVVYRQQISDQIKFWSFTPNAEITQLAERGGLSQQGKFYFYVTHPQLDLAPQFNAECRRVEQGSPILGCYDSAKDSISIFNITNHELDGIKEVTAAHEMLHAVFARLPSSGRSALTSQLEAAYQRIKTPKLEERMAYYERSEPGARANELHSIIGTEYADIGAELEQYYAKFFTDRQKIVKLHDGYNQKFEDIENQSAQLAADLKRRLAEIDNLTNQYQADLKILNQKISAFNKRAQNGEFDSQEQFTRDRAALQSEASNINSRQKEIAGMIEQYNGDVERLNSLGGQMQQLNRSLDSLQAVEQ